MSSKAILALAGLLTLTGVTLAQQPTPVLPASAPVPDHKAYDQRARECRKLGLEQKLSGEELLAFVSLCLNPKRTEATNTQ